MKLFPCTRTLVLLCIALVCSVVTLQQESLGIGREVNVFGGRLVSAGEFPYLVYIIVNINTPYSYACSGGLLNRRYVITAGHW
jgi:secreted trypsin-like serine protease